MNPPRIPPLAPPYSETVERELAKIMPPGVPPLALFATLATNERVFARVMAGGLLDRGSLTLRERELVIDRTCWRCGAEYEWGVHVAVYGAKAKLSPAEIAATCSADPDALAAAFSPREQLLVQLCDELHATARVSDALWSSLAAEFSPAQLVELVVLAGYYHAIAYAVNAFGVRLEPWAARFPTATGG